MSKQKLFAALLSTAITFSVSSQATHNIIDPERKYKEVKEMMVKEDYAMAYPITKELKALYTGNTASDHAYLNEDVSYYYIICELKLMQEIATDDAEKYIHEVNNEPRRQ